jgi:hypothetical protein
MRRAWRLSCLVLAAWLGAAGAAAAQETPSSSSAEFWPEIDLWLRLSPAWRLSSFAALSKNIETAYREGSLIFQADFTWGKFKRVIKRRMFDEDRAREMRAWMVRAGYLNGRSLDDQGEAYREDTALVELHLRNPLKGRVLVSHRLRTDLRWLGEEREFSVRARYRLMVEKEFLAGRASIIPYVNIEPSFDSRYQVVNRVRLCGGATVSLWQPVALEGNFTYQHDSKASITDIYAVNVILHVFF